MRKLTLIILLIIISIAAVTGNPGNTKRQIPAVTRDAEAAPAIFISDTPGAVDGAKNPELIPDSVAYSLFFGFIAGRQSSEAEKSSMREYFKQTDLDGVDVEVLLAVADEFQRRMEAAPDQASRQVIIAETTASLPNL